MLVDATVLAEEKQKAVTTVAMITYWDRILFASVCHVDFNL